MHKGFRGSSDRGSSYQDQGQGPKRDAEYYRKKAGFPQESQQTSEVSDANTSIDKAQVNSVKKQAVAADKIYRYNYVHLPEELKTEAGRLYDRHIVTLIEKRDAFNSHQSNENFESCQKAANDLTVVANTVRASAFKERCTKLLNNLEPSKNTVVKDTLAEYDRRTALSQYARDITEARKQYRDNPHTENVKMHESAVLQLEPLRIELEQLAQEAQIFDRVDRR
jgi:hypothetical protein